MTDTFVVVGAGLAAANAVTELRAAGFTGEIVVYGEEHHLPYERPPLSKDILLGKKPRDTAYVFDEPWYAEHDVELVLGTTVTGVHRGDRQIELVGGDRLDYDKLLLATGSAPRRLTVPGADLDGVHYLRRIGESERLRDLLVGGGSLAVVGAGWIGLEVAAAARHHGCAVTIVEPQATPLAGPLGEEVGAHFARLHRAHGVDLRLGTGVTGFEGDGRVTGVRTSAGDVVPADAVVVGVGIVPNTRLAASADLEVVDGIVTDDLLQTSDPAIWAAGDVASAAHPVLGERVRVEHWSNALNQGAAAGRAMAGKGEPYTRLPYFFTDQYDVGMEYHGHVGRDGYDRVVVRGEPESGRWFAFWLREGVLLAAMHVNMWDDSDDVKALARARARVDPAGLADPDTPLSGLL